MFGIDSATWDLIRPWVAEGKLPGFKKLLSGGAACDLMSTVPPLTPVAWPTMMTGSSPGDHGSYDFYSLDKNRELTVNLASDIPYPFVWELLSDAGLRVAAVNIPITFPVRPLNGIMVGGLLTPGLKSDFIYPPELKKEFIKKFPRYEFNPRVKATRNDPESYRTLFKEIKKEVTDVIAVSDWVLGKEKWDFFAMNFMAVDHVQHFFWNDKRAMLEIYRLVDKYLERVLKKYGRTHRFLVVSDHGAGPLEKTMFLNVWLKKRGYLRFKNTPAVVLKRLLSFLGMNPDRLITLASKLRLVRHSGKMEMGKRNRLMNRLVLSYADIDWDRTEAYSFGMYGGIYLTRKNKTLIKKIIGEMQADFGTDLTFIDSSQNLYGTDRYPATIPDIQFLMREGAIVSTNIYAFSGHRLFTDPITHKSGEHRMKGILALYPGQDVLKETENASLLDITPTILDYFGVALPDYCRGRSLFKKEIRDGKLVEGIEI